MGLSTTRILLAVLCGLGGYGCDSPEEGTPMTDEAPADEESDSSEGADADEDTGSGPGPDAGAEAGADTGADADADEGSDTGTDEESTTTEDLRGVHVYTTRELDDGSTEVVCDATLGWRLAALQTDNSYFHGGAGYVGRCEGCEYQLRLNGPSRTSLYEACGPGVFDGWSDLADLEPWEEDAILDARSHHSAVAELAFADSWDPAIYYYWAHPYTGEVTIREDGRRMHYLAHYPSVDGVSDSTLQKTTFWQTYGRSFGYFHGDMTWVHGESYGFEPATDFGPSSFESDRRSVEWSGSHTHPEDPTLTTQIRARVVFGDECPTAFLVDGEYEYGGGVPGDDCGSEIDRPDFFSEVIDCDGCCVRESAQVSYWGDGICDDAMSSHINLNCAAFDFDAGDCSEASE